MHKDHVLEILKLATSLTEHGATGTPTNKKLEAFDSWIERLSDHYKKLMSSDDAR